MRILFRRKNRGVGGEKKRPFMSEQHLMQFFGVYCQFHDSSFTLMGILSTYFLRYYTFWHINIVKATSSELPHIRYIKFENYRQKALIKKLLPLLCHEIEELKYVRVTSQGGTLLVLHYLFIIGPIISAISKQTTVMISSCTSQDMSNIFLHKKVNVLQNYS